MTQAIILSICALVVCFLACWYFVDRILIYYSSYIIPNWECQKMLSNYYKKQFKANMNKLRYGIKA